jgi:hypothetical protein
MDDAAIAEACLHRSTGLTVDDGHVMPKFTKIVCGGIPYHASTNHDCSGACHGPFLP